MAQSKEEDVFRTIAWALVAHECRAGDIKNWCRKFAIDKMRITRYRTSLLKIDSRDLVRYVTDVRRKVDQTRKDIGIKLPAADVQPDTNEVLIRAAYYAGKTLDDWDNAILERLELSSHPRGANAVSYFNIVRRWRPKSWIGGWRAAHPLSNGRSKANEHARDTQPDPNKVGFKPQPNTDTRSIVSAATSMLEVSDCEKCEHLEELLLKALSELKTVQRKLRQVDSLS